ncbi:hypothetical protein [Amycolatopsis sp. PS_44_ISF1]|uniref:hypothetical protein n=1 Tax=Amycolatopsis sp. PS_44_ISF1 TaxID=2974917 RepID=UPI0028DE3BB9|nr:hypothetical protein [Amycolatopsis sp. PS_44_ISF1]MDT8910883.1 hypothetical protein [Amycolatopsis sp. PS_44_ISF1]
MNPKIYKTGAITGPDTGQYVGMILSTTDIPDPGYPYQLSFSGQIWLSLGTPAGVDVTIRDGATLGGKVLSLITSIDGGMVGNQGGKLPFPITGTSPPLTGARSVSLAITKWKGGNGDGWQHGTEVFTSVTMLLTAA